VRRCTRGKSNGSRGTAAPLHEQPRPTRPEPGSVAYTWSHLTWGHLLVAAAGTRGVAGGAGRSVPKRGSCTRGGGPGSPPPSYPLWRAEMTPLPSEKRRKARAAGPATSSPRSRSLYASSFSPPTPLASPRSILPLPLHLSLSLVPACAPFLFSLSKKRCI
jgi:hypothetical protein